MEIQKLEKIEEALKRREITASEAYEKINSTTKPWQTAAWKKKRETLIKDSCEQCGSSKGPMVIQHLWHPTKYKDNVDEIYKQFLNKEQNNISIPEVTDEEVMNIMSGYTEQKEVCPSCEMRSISKRKTITPLYRCSKCKHEFDEPKMAPFNPELNTVAPSIEEIKISIKLDKKRKSFWNTYGEEIQTLAVLKGIEDHKRYISMVDTKTFCQRCAFLWDKKRLKVCAVCKENLIILSMYACDDCQDEGHPAFL